MSQNVNWYPKLYLKYDSLRLRPAIDLISRISIENPRRIADLGCGPGNVTQILKERWPDAEITGIDGSEEMLDRARNSYPDIEWLRQDLTVWHDEKRPDLIFSNAALHWLEDHETVFTKLLESLSPQGTLAIQMPRNWEAPSHTSIHETVVEGPWRELLEPVVRLEPSLSPESYYNILSGRTQKLDLWETEYVQVLEGDNPVADFVKGSWLQRFLQVLNEPQRSEFEARYREKILNAYPKQPDGKTLFSFRRLFITAEV